MPKRVKQRRNRRPKDMNQPTHRLVELTTAEPDPVAAANPPAVISEYMAAIGRKGGRIGGKRRLRTLTAKERTRIAKQAAKARWTTRTKKED